MIHQVRMNRIIQLVALMVALLLASQSAFADYPCAHWLRSGNTHDSTCCAVAIDIGSHLPADCHSPMRSTSFGAECSECGCSAATSQVAAQPNASPEFKAYRGAALVAITQLPDLAPIARPAESFQSSSASGPAKHLLGHVFRI
jgi:hypothetical protein